MQVHTIRNQNQKHIIDYKIRNEVNHMLENGLNYTYIGKQKVEIHSDFRHSDGSRDTVVSVEFS